MITIKQQIITIYTISVPRDHYKNIPISLIDCYKYLNADSI